MGQQICIATDPPVFLQRVKGILEKMSEPKICRSLLWQFPAFKVPLISGTGGQQAGEESNTSFIVFLMLGAADVRCFKCRFLSEEM